MAVATIENLLLNDPLLVEGVLYLQKIHDKQDIIEHIWKLFHIADRSIELQSFIMQREVSNTNAIEQLMREDSCYISLIQYNLRSYGTQWIQKQLSSPIRKILSSKASFEIDPIKIKESEDISSNLRNLLQYTSIIIDEIIYEIKHIPKIIIKLCNILHRLTVRKFPLSGYFSLASYLFLRFICPITTAPESISLIKPQSITKKGRRKLILVTKIIQALANNSIPSNEDYMNVVHDYIKDKSKEMEEFFKKILKGTDEIPQTRKKRKFSKNMLLAVKSKSLVLIHPDLDFSKDLVNSQDVLFSYIKEHHKILEESFYPKYCSIDPALSISKDRCCAIVSNSSTESLFPISSDNWLKTLTLLHTINNILYNYDEVQIKKKKNIGKPIRTKSKAKTNLFTKKPIQKLSPSRFEESDISYEISIQSDSETD